MCLFYSTYRDCKHTYFFLYHHFLVGDVGNGAHEFMSAFHVIASHYPAFLPPGPHKVFPSFQRPRKPRRRNLKSIGVVDGIIDIECPGKLAAHIFAIGDGYTALPVYIDSQKPSLPRWTEFNLNELKQAFAKDGYKYAFYLFYGFRGGYHPGKN